ncbi:hypothetical protein [Zhihengliuella halotolerans]|uniref:Uncharacterized protein n=1 Tax=Zhihengliuella halotolerans TaxID=370736 RepID=A0A4Q8AEY2_9MICC|nr:hypothetical protein [Zhihengliuella halotolerans]RZU62159.1 hypothetical protein EV380_1748 [Zhihengliuella halotolerans]
MSNYPVAPEPQETAAPEPSKFAMLKKLTLVSAALYLISTLVSLPAAMDNSAIREQMEMSGTTVDDAMLQAAQGVAIGTAIATLVVGLGLYALVIIGLYKRKNWARVLGIIFAILSLVGFLIGLFASGLMPTVASTSVFTTILGIVSALVTVYWLVLAFSSQVAEYLRKPSPLA